MVKYFIDPFAISGDKSAIPDASQPDGSVSYDQGFGPDYQLDPADPSSLDVPRDQFNQFGFDITSNIQQYQQFGFPNFITSSDNGGSPFPYSKNASVRASDGNNYYSLIDTNTDTPPSSNWALFSFVQTPEPTGVGKDFWGSSLPSGYVWANGTTIGSAASGSTGRANADTINLYTALWTAAPNTTLIIQTSAGAATTRGVSAAADFAADKRLPVPDKRDLASFGKGDMGGTTDRGLITTGKSGISGATMAATGGLETVQLTGNQNGTHTHTGSTDSAGVHTHNLSQVPDSGLGVFPTANSVQTLSNNIAPPTVFIPIPATPTDSAGAHTHTLTTGSSGLGSDHQNMPPAIICNYIIKL